MNQSAPPVIDKGFFYVVILFFLFFRHINILKFSIIFIQFLVFRDQDLLPNSRLKFV